MQRAFSILLFVLLGSFAAAGSVRAQNAEAVLSDCVSAIQKGNPDAMFEHFAQSVSVTLPPNTEDNYARNQALFVLKDFFAAYPVQSFSILHKGSSGAKYYAIGRFVSPKGTFDANIFLKKSGNSYVLDEIRFEKTN